MKRTAFRLRLCIALLILNLAFIWGNSLLPGELSAAFSQWLKALLAFGGDDPHTGHGLLRKLAHVSEFACLGILLSWLLGMCKKPIAPAAGFGFLAACADELIQCFVPDRGPGVKDVFIDTAGVLLGMGLVLLCLRQKTKHSKENIQ